MSSLDSLHPAVAAWFRRSFDAPTEAQSQAWPAIQARRHVLVAAPTGSGKTLAAFLAAIDELVREGLHRPLPDETRIVYVSPLKALSNDIERNLASPLDGIRRELFERGLPDVDIRAWVRTGDTPQQERAQMRRRPPHIVVTTPESLYILLGSQSGREMLATTRTVIVDEIHALAGNKRGAHLALSLARLEALTAQRMGGLLGGLTRIGLSATQKPIEAVARFLTAGACTIVDGGHARKRDLALELPPVPLDAVMSGETWSLVYDRLAQLVTAHRTTLVFVNTRRLAERLARQLTERLGAEQVMAHHGSMARERRWQAEQRLKRGELKVLVATASLELGIDIGDVDLVCQIASPHSINAFLQRVGRSGHAVGGTPKGRLFPLSRDDLVECAALLDAVRRGELDVLHVPPGTLDVLSQHIVAEVAGQEWDDDGLYRLVREAQPYAQLPREDFDAVLRMLAEGFSTRRGRQQGALIHHDGIHHRLRPRRGSRLTALTSGGAIPDTADYQVMLEPEAHIVGSVNEDFAVESMAGDVFQLGNTSYRILRVERGTVRVEDAQGVPPTIPFWLGEAPGRTDELSGAVSRLRQELARHLESEGRDAAARAWLMHEVGLDESAASQLTAYLAAALAALGCLPARDTVVLERFFDEAGGMQLVLHAPFGSRVNRAWGLSLRKRFCRQFNFELQAAATEDALVLSLTTAHSFELMEVASYLRSDSAQHILEQALFAAPMFTTRWRWVAAISLALPRFRGGRKVPPPLARMNAEDLLAGVFPDQVACAENLPGEIEVPDHPLVRQCICDCLHEAMDLDGFLATLAGIESGAVRVVARDLTEPSPLALEVLSARPYAFLDDAPLEERRTQAVMSRRFLAPQSAAGIGRLDPEAIARVREEAWPAAATADELHDALMWLGFLTQAEANANTAWPALLAELESQGRVMRRAGSAAAQWIATERRHWWSSDEGQVLIIRGRLDGLGPVTVQRLAQESGLAPARVSAALGALQAQGTAMSGRFTPEGLAADVTEWCERGLLARIHRYTVKTLRAQIEPVAARDFLRFLCDWQRASPAARMQGPEALTAVLDQLEGCEVAAGAWESEILPARIAEYDPAWLDEHGLAGRYVWARLCPPARTAVAAGPVRSTPITLLPRRQMRVWSALTAVPVLADTAASPAARAVAEHLTRQGASFYDDLVHGAGLLPAQGEAALGELAALGLVNCGGFGGLRALLLPAQRQRPARGRRGRRVLFGMADSGRWALVHRHQPAAREEAVEHVVRTLLRRWGVIFWRLMAAEADWLPPWRELMVCCRRLEARGEIRGGRFVAGFSGEQYALPEAVALLRESRRQGQEARWVSLSAADPLNLIGILTPGPRLPALAGNRLLYRDGLPVATLAAGEVRFMADMDESARWQAQNLLVRSATVLSPVAVKPAD